MYSQSYARVCLFRSDCGRICLGFWGTKKNDNKHKGEKKGRGLQTATRV